MKFLKSLLFEEKVEGSWGLVDTMKDNGKHLVPITMFRQFKPAGISMGLVLKISSNEEVISNFEI